MCLVSRARTRNTLLGHSLRDSRASGSVRGQPNPGVALTRAPAQTFSLVIGAVLTVAGVVGFLYNGDFGTGTHVPSDDVLGILSVNGWHNLVHLVTGLVGLRAARTWS